MVIKSVTIIDTGDAGVIIIKKLRSRSRLSELFCGFFGSDSRDKADTEFDLDEHSYERKAYNDGDRGKDNGVNDVCDDFLHFHANTEVKEGCLRRLWRRLKALVHRFGHTKSYIVK
ncbi:hypothetical protein ACF0H5_002137 [Mactra antiquata]